MSERRWPIDQLAPGIARLPRIALADAPTPVERLTAIADYLGRDDVWVKRDDRISAVYGGNKVRRYEFVLADARARGAKKILTVGGFASTQVQATALFGRALGFAVTAVLFKQPITRFAKRALLASAGAGATLVYGGGYLMTVLRALGCWWRERGYFIAPGAASPLANIGYVDAMLELGEQVARGEMPRPDYILLPTGSSGTLAALAIGAALLGWSTEILGVRITSAIACNRLTINFLIRQTAAFLRQHGGPALPHAPRYRLLPDQLGPGYGEPTIAAREAIAQVQRFSGVPGEVTYSGKALAALREVAQAMPGKAILYWHTLSGTEPPAGDPQTLPVKLRRLLDIEPVA
jgi:D-cysteine desulfhydrase